MFHPPLFVPRRRAGWFASGLLADLGSGPRAAALADPWRQSCARLRCVSEPTLAITSSLRKVWCGGGSWLPVENSTVWDRRAPVRSGGEIMIMFTRARSGKVFGARVCRPVPVRDPDSTEIYVVPSESRFLRFMHTRGALEADNTCLSCNECFRLIYLGLII